jgi:hypothetical protein
MAVQVASVTRQLRDVLREQELAYAAGTAPMPMPLPVPVPVAGSL